MKVAEGTLDWKKISWILDEKNYGLDEIISHILPKILDSSKNFISAKSNISTVQQRLSSLLQTTTKKQEPLSSCFIIAQLIPLHLFFPNKITHALLPLPLDQYNLEGQIRRKSYQLNKHLAILYP